MTEFGLLTKMMLPFGREVACRLGVL
jgi:hypothetical protein